MNKKNIILQKLENFAMQNKIPSWPFNEKNAYLITYVGILYNDVFTLLTSYIFDSDLCLHKSIDDVDEEFNVLHFKNTELKNFKFFNSNLKKKQYYEKYLAIFSNYKQFIESAVLYYLKISIEKNDLFSFMYLFSLILTGNKTYTSVLYNDIKSINLFSSFTLECLDGLFSHFSDFEIISTLSFNNTNAFLTIERDNRIFRFIHMFSFYFSPKFRALCFKDCMKTKSYIPLFLALKIYQTNLVSGKLTLKELNEINSIFNFKITVIGHNIISEQNINQLIEKNWKYHNYE